MAKTFTATAFLFGLALSIAGCGGGDDAKKDGDDKNGGTTVDLSTPQKTAESFKAAIESEDWAQVFKCITPESQDMFAQIPVQTLKVAKAFGNFGKKDGKADPKLEKMEEVLKKHGVDLDAEKPLANVSDKGALFADFMQLSKEEADPKKKGGPFARMKDDLSKTTFTNFEIDGDSATCDVKVEGKPDDKGFFKKIDDKWYVDFAESMKQKKRRRSGIPKKKAN